MKRTLPVISALSLSVIAVGLLLLLLVTTPVLASPSFQEGVPFPSPVEAQEAAVNWLVTTHQNSDGGYTSFSFGADQADSDIGGTIDALLALNYAGAERSGPLGYLAENVEDLVTYGLQDESTAGKLVLALSTAGLDPRDFEGEDFVVTLTTHLSQAEQSNVKIAFNQALAILGLAAAGESVPESSVEWLLSLQASDGDLAGSWDDGFGTMGNADSTAIAIMALIASGRSSEDDEITAALDFLGQAQLDSGGWEYGPGFGENANSTALVLQALVVAGEDLTSAGSPWQTKTVTPQTALLAWQSESGAFQADFGDGRFDDFFSTVQSIPALSFLPEPAPEPTEVPTETPEPTATAKPTVAPTETPLPPTEKPEPTNEPTAERVVVSPASETPQNSGQSAPEDSGGSTMIIILVAVGLVLLVIGVIVAVRRLGG